MPLLARHTLYGIRAFRAPIRARRRGRIVKSLDNICGGCYNQSTNSNMYPYFLIRERERRSGCFGSLGGGEEERMGGWLRYLLRRKMRYQTFLHNVEALPDAGFALSL